MIIVWAEAFVCRDVIIHYYRFSRLVSFHELFFFTNTIQRFKNK